MRIILASLGTIALLATAYAAPAKQPERTAKSLECSKQADTENLHGKPRQAFMRTCKKS